MKLSLGFHKHFLLILYMDVSEALDRSPKYSLAHNSAPFLSSTLAILIELQPGSSFLMMLRIVGAGSPSVADHDDSNMRTTIPNPPPTRAAFTARHGQCMMKRTNAMSRS